MSKFFTYIVDADGTYYTGWTTDLERRLRQHNGLIAGGAKYTRGKACKLMWAQELSSRSSAMKYEAAIKRLTHTDKKLIVASTLFGMSHFIEKVNEAINKPRKMEC